MSVADLQDRLERVMEENVWLQTELDEQKIQMDEQTQRLRDEIRGMLCYYLYFVSFILVLTLNIDLKLEISIMERKQPTEVIYLSIYSSSLH